MYLYKYSREYSSTTTSTCRILHEYSREYSSTSTGTCKEYSTSTVENTLVQVQVHAKNTPQVQ